MHEKVVFVCQFDKQFWLYVINPSLKLTLHTHNRWPPTFKAGLHLCQFLLPGTLKHLSESLKRPTSQLRPLPNLWSRKSEKDREENCDVLTMSLATHFNLWPLTFSYVTISFIVNRSLPFHTGSHNLKYIWCCSAYPFFMSRLGLFQLFFKKPDWGSDTTVIAERGQGLVGVIGEGSSFWGGECMRKMQIWTT